MAERLDSLWARGGFNRDLVLEFRDLGQSFSILPFRWIKCFLLVRYERSQQSAVPSTPRFSILVGKI